MLCYHQPRLPCLHCQPHGYIRMVQHLIERCLMFRMNRDGCVVALAKHASIRPQITTTVWDELMKENKNFFEAYHLAFNYPTDFNNNPDERMLDLRSENIWR